jgi:hypothetical protein
MDKVFSYVQSKEHPYAEMIDPTRYISIKLVIHDVLEILFGLEIVV